MATLQSNQANKVVFLAQASIYVMRPVNVVTLQVWKEPNARNLTSAVMGKLKGGLWIEPGTRSKNALFSLRVTCLDPLFSFHQNHVEWGGFNPPLPPGFPMLFLLAYLRRLLPRRLAGALF